MKLFNGLTITTEAIDFQPNNKVFKDELIEQIENIKQKLINNIYKDNNEVIEGNVEIKRIIDFIFKRTGVRLEFLRLYGKDASDTKYNASVQLLNVNYLSSLSSSDLREMVYSDIGHYDTNKEIYNQTIYENLQKIKGSINTIDLKNAKISGEFNKIKNSIYVDFKGLMLTAKLTAGEIASIIIHEIGHIFTYLEFNNKTNIINQAFYNIANHSKLDDKDKLIKVTFSELKNVDKDLTEKEVSDMLSSNSLISSMALFKYIVKNTDLNNLMLDLSDYNSDHNTETVADIFATRMGFGPELITGLNKLHNYVNKYNPYETFFWAILIMSSLYYMLLVSGLFITMINSTLVLGMYLLTRSSLLDTALFYKDEKERPQKIYNEIVDSLKEFNYTSEQKKETLESLRAMKQVIDLIPKTIPVLDKLIFTISKSQRLDRSYEYQQDILERLASNELFVKSVELELLKKGA